MRLPRFCDKCRLNTPSACNHCQRLKNSRKAHKANVLTSAQLSGNAVLLQWIEDHNDHSSDFWADAEGM